MAPHKSTRSTLVNNNNIVSFSSKKIEGQNVYQGKQGGLSNILRGGETVRQSTPNLTMTMWRFRLTPPLD